MSHWIKCEDQDWINLDQMAAVFVEEWDEDGEFKVMASTPDGESYTIAGHTSLEEAYQHMDEVVRFNSRPKK